MINFFLLGVILVGVFFLIRNEAVYRVRKSFIDAPDFMTAYFALPEYGAMLHSPRYLTLWTEAHWRAWLARQADVSQ